MKSSVDKLSIYEVLKHHKIIGWHDLIVDNKAIHELKKFATLLHERKKYEAKERYELENQIETRALFYGEQGTGKKLATQVLANETGYDIFLIKTSGLFSKYIGETEKNLSKLFNKAEGTDVILLFDEADALFGKRTEVKDSNKQLANQILSYLFQLISSTSAVVVLNFNNQLNLDFPYFKHFNIITEFRLPNVHQRLLLWNKYLPSSVRTGEDINLEELAIQYELSGGSIVAAIKHASGNKPDKVDRLTLINAARREMAVHNART